ncbi:DNA-binding transcriptional LysR family regulator [Bradyrhizobium sp. LM3.6]
MTEASWDLFRLFSVVARTGSVNRAAHELGMSQPTLSRRLKELERYVAAPLFFRASSGVKLTREGEDLQRSAGDMMLAFESFHRDLRSRVGQRSSVVRISATEGMTKHWLLPRVAELRRRDSRIYLEIISTVNQQSLATSDLDYVIRMGDPGENDLIGKRVADVPMGIFASERYLAGRPAPRSLSELRDHDIIGHTADFVSFRNVRPNQRDLLEYFLGSGGHPQRCSGQPNCQPFRRRRLRSRACASCCTIRASRGTGSGLAARDSYDERMAAAPARERPEKIDS